MNIFNLFKTKKKKLSGALSTSGISEATNHRAGFPPRMNTSLEDYMHQSAKEKMQMGGLGTLHMTRSWDDELKGTVLDVPVYTAFLSTPIIKINFSDRLIGSLDTILDTIESNRKPALYTKLFTDNNYPILRTIFCFRDDPGNPLLLESPLDLPEADFQDFYVALQTNDSLDLIMKHSNKIIALSCSYDSRVPKMFQAEVDKAKEQYKKVTDSNGFKQTVSAMENTFASANDGVTNQDLIDLEYNGEAKNQIIKLDIECRP